MGLSKEEMRAYKAKWNRDKRASDPEFAAKDRERSASYNKNVIRKGLDAYEKFNIVGRVFGKLTVIEKLDNKFFVCDCACGNKGLVKIRHGLMTGESTHCGCIRKMNNLKHGGSRRSGRDKEYSTWCGIKARCLNADSPSYPDYGARGISICERWVSSYDNFIADMGHKTHPKYTVERRDNDGNYEPGNCYWGTYTEQANNRRSTIKITYNNTTKSIMQWSEYLKIEYFRLHYLLVRKKMPIQEVVSLYATV